MIEQMFTYDQTSDPCWEFAKNIDSGLRGTNVKSFWRRDLAPGDTVADASIDIHGLSSPIHVDKWIAERRDA